MKILFFILSIGCAFGKEVADLKFNVRFEDSESPDYSSQLKAGFSKLLNENQKLAEQFHLMENPPADDARGRYSGDPIVQVLVLAESKNAHFREESGDQSFEKTIALYYRFDEGMHGGSKTNSAFFAVFIITGKIEYEGIGDKLKIKTSEVTATFKGLERSLAFTVTPSP